MAAAENNRSYSTSELVEVLKPFYQRASEAEDRISRLEAALASKQGAGNDELPKTISELQLKVEAANAEMASERKKNEELLKAINELKLKLEAANAEASPGRKKAEILALENAKLQYRVTHLVRAIKEVETELKNKEGCSEVIEQTVPTLENLHL